MPVGFGELPLKALIRNIVKQLGFELRRRQRFDDVASYGGYPRESLDDRRFYNIGAGSFAHRYWTNIDYGTEHYSKMQTHRFVHYDLMALEPLPIASNSAELVYSSHTIEHVTDEAVRNMLAESHRILKPGGAIRLTTPDAALEFQAFIRRDRAFWYWIDGYSRRGAWETLYKIPLSKASIEQLFLHHFASQLCEIDIDDSPLKKYSDAEIRNVFSANPDVRELDRFTKQCRYNPDHPGNHVNWWTHEKLTTFLVEAGFAEFYRSGWGQSRFAAMRDTNLFDNTHPAISLYVEAIK